MNKFLFSFLVFSSIYSFSKAQVNVDFENINLGAQGYNNGSDLSGGFESSGLFLKNNYSPSMNVWEGFSISSTTDTVTTDYANQYSSFAGAASEGSKYAIAFSFNPSVLVNSNPLQLKKLISFRYSNSTIAALIMKNGDGFSKKFGGVSGNDPDFFKLRVINYFNGQKTDSAEVFLADFRNIDNSQDFIVKSWRTATFNFSSPFDSLSFQLQSSDNGAFGMNTPAYFCLDEIQFSNFTTIAETTQISEFKAFPNPFQNKIEIVSNAKLKHFALIDQLGRNIELAKSQNGDKMLLNTENLVSGIYFLSIGGKDRMKLIKN